MSHPIPLCNAFEACAETSSRSKDGQPAPSPWEISGPSSLSGWSACFCGTLLVNGNLEATRLKGICDGRTVCHHERRKGRSGKMYILQSGRESRRRSTRLSILRRSCNGAAALTSVVLVVVRGLLLGGDVLLLETTPRGKDLWESVRGAKFERVAQKAELFRYVGEFGLAPELETGYPADFFGVPQLCFGYTGREA
jgi:hypothetical protein